jgi:hypothetical protein
VYYERRAEKIILVESRINKVIGLIEWKKVHNKVKIKVRLSLVLFSTTP